MHTMTLSTPRGRSRGFTLLEIAIAGSVVAIGLLGFAASLLAARDMHVSTHQTTIAMNIARYALEEIENIDDLDYIVTNINGYTFEVEGLNPPWAGKAFPDGSLPSYTPSTLLPDLYVAGPVAGGTPPVVGSPPDPVLDTTNDLRGLGLTPATAVSPSTGYGIFTVDNTDPDLLVIQVRIEWGTNHGNRRLVFTALKGIR